MKLDINELSQSKEYLRLRNAHDALKEHPYRNGFSPMWEREYNNCLYELAKAWCELILSSPVTEYERGVLRKFSGWVHNYSASLLFHDIKQELIPYYECIIAMTHRFLDTGDLSSYYQLEGRPGSYRYIRYYLVTPELCGIESAELPRYLPQSQLLSEDEGKVREWLVAHSFRSTDDEIDRKVSLWKQKLLPVIQWHNRGLRDTGISEEAPLYKSM